jgi:hypothetical protein
VLFSALIKRYFEENKSLRSELYANYIFSIATKLLKTRDILSADIVFAIKNIRYFNISKLLNVIATRKMVGPKKSL